MKLRRILALALACSLCAAAEEAKRDEKGKAEETLEETLARMDARIAELDAEIEADLRKLRLASEDLNAWAKVDENGVLWPRNLSVRTCRQAGLILSSQSNGIVIVIVADKQQIDDAVGMAVKMSRVIAKNEHTPKSVPVIAMVAKGMSASYSLHLNGVNHSEKASGKEVFTASEVKTQLAPAVQKYFEVREKG